MSKSQQRKGRSGELELVKLLNQHGIPAEPGKAVSYGSTPDVTGFPGVHVEVKRVERLNVSAAFAQAKRDAERFKDGIKEVKKRICARIRRSLRSRSFLSALSPI